MKVFYETAPNEIRRHIRESLQNGQRISKIVLESRQELIDIYEESIPFGLYLVRLPLQLYASVGEATFLGVKIEWPKSWGAL